MKSEVNISGNRLQITRTFNAPRPIVFSWWTNADKLQQWSGCKECVKCEIVMDFRVGGSFTQNMKLAVHGGIHDYSLTGVYEEILKPERIVYRVNMGNSASRVALEFFEQGNSTKLILTHEGLPDEFFRQNVSQGTSESLDKLAVLITSQPVAADL